MITLVGVAHVIDIRNHIQRIIIEENPDVVAVELDYGRYIALTTRQRGRVPYIYRKMAEMQKSLADMMGTEVGSEMLVAVDTAKTMGKKVAFIDMDAPHILESIKRNMSLWEKFKMYSLLIFAPIAGKRIGKKDVENIVEREDELIRELRRKYPGLSRALFDERENFMAHNLENIERSEEGEIYILAFVGDGHLKGLKKRLPHARAIKLRDMFSHTLSFSYTVRSG